MTVSVASHFAPLLANTDRWLVMFGGAGSGKSVFACQKILQRVLSEQGHRLLVVRKVAATLRDSVWAEMLRQIRVAGFRDNFTEHKQEMRLVAHDNAGNELGEIIFKGLDDPEKIKSISGITGGWIEEGTELVPADLDQLDLRLRGNTATYKQWLLTFNPISSRHFLKKRFCNASPGSIPGGHFVHHSTYLDNPFLDAQYKEVLCGNTGNNHTVYTLGQWGELKGLVYRSWPIAGSAHKNPDETIYGLDFGFNNPTALVRVDIRDAVSHLTENVYESGLTNSALIARLEALDISRTAPIYADAAEPDRIEEIARAGYNVIPASKGQGSVAAGISHVQGSDIRVVAGSENIIAENGAYRWRTDRNDDPLDEPEKQNDHAMDAIRYALFSHANHSQFSIS